jgi:hypothetical protein
MATGQWETERLIHEMEQQVLQRIDQLETSLNEKLEKIMATQADIDAMVAQLNTSVTDLQGQSAAIGEDVTAIQQALANPGNIDITALQAAVASLATNQSNLDASVGTLNDVVPAAPASGKK